MPKVYAPQQPCKHDRATGLDVPTVNLGISRPFGELVVLLPANANRLHSAPLVDAMHAGMKHFSKEDYLIAVGDPTLIAAAAVLAYQKTGHLRMLRWDRLTSDYIEVLIKP
jgi:hypothetical protein